MTQYIVFCSKVLEADNFQSDRSLSARCAILYSKKIHLTYSNVGPWYTNLAILFEKQESKMHIVNVSLG